MNKCCSYLGRFARIQSICYFFTCLMSFCRCYSFYTTPFFRGGDFDHWLEAPLRVSLMFITFRRRNYDKATLCQLSDVIHHLKENAEVSSTIREFLQTLTEKKVEIFHSVLRRLVTSLHPVSLFQTTDGNPST